MSSYSVEHGGVQDNVRRLDTAAEDIGTARSQIPAMCPVPDAFGGEDAGPAFAKFLDAWQDEARTIQAAIGEIADKLRVTTNNYALAEDSATAGVHRAAGPGATAPAGVAAGSSHSGPSPFG